MPSDLKKRSRRYRVQSKLYKDQQEVVKASGELAIGVHKTCFIELGLKVLQVCKFFWVCLW